MRDKNATINTLSRYLSWWLAAILVLLPFHAFFTTWLGSNFQHLDAWRIWKEVAIVMALPFTLWLCLKKSELRRWLKTDWLVRLCLLYASLFLSAGLWALYQHHVNQAALIYGWLSDLRYFGLMLIIMAVVAVDDFLRRHWVRIMLGSSLIVVIFGLLQRFALSYDFLHHFGYGPKTIPAYQTVDQKLEYRRVQSTLRGANPLGAYLVLILTVAASQWHRRQLRWLVGGLMLGGLMVLGFTYSRSAWLALLPAVGLVLWWQYNNPKLHRLILLGLAAVLVAGGTSLLLARQDRVLQNTFFHTDSTSLSPQSSNAGRAAALEAGLRDVWHEPLGRGPGTAGPASTRNNHPGRIAENYYIQIAQEVGWLGLGLFIAINLLIVIRLWRQRTDPLVQVLLAGWLGLSLVNLVSHAWADDTLGLLFFGLVGIALAPYKPAGKSVGPHHK